MLWVKQAEQKTSLSEQGTPCVGQEENENVQPVEARLGFSGTWVQSCGSFTQREDMKGQSFIRAETGQCCFK